MGEEVSFHTFSKKRTPNYLEKEKFRVIMKKKKKKKKKKKLLQNLYLKLRNTITIFYQEIEIVINCNRFWRKDLIETLQTMETLLLKALREKDFGHELQEMFTLFRIDLHNFKLETQLETSTHIVDKK